MEGTGKSALNNYLLKTPGWFTAISGYPTYGQTRKKRRRWYLWQSTHRMCVRTLLHGAGSDRKVLVDRELDRYFVEIWSSEWDSPCRGRVFKRGWWRLHFLLEWTKERRTAWSRNSICHEVSPCQEALRLPKGINDRLMTLQLRIPLKPAIRGANHSVAHEEAQSNRVSDFLDFVCSLFPKATLFDFYFPNLVRAMRQMKFSKTVY